MCRIENGNQSHHNVALESGSLKFFPREDVSIMSSVTHSLPAGLFQVVA